MLKRKLFFAALTIGSFLVGSSFYFSGTDLSFSENDNAVIATDTSDSRCITINDEYSLMIPNHLTKTSELNDDASLQYQDTEDELYIIVIDESKSEFIQAFNKARGYDANQSTEVNYRKIQMKSMGKSIKKKGKPVIQKLRIHGMEAEIVDMIGKVKGIKSPIFYKFAFIESDKKLYMVMTWTLADYQKRHHAEMEEMLRSFEVK